MQRLGGRKCSAGDCKRRRTQRERETERSVAYHEEKGSVHIITLTIFTQFSHAWSSGGHPEVLTEAPNLDSR